MIAGHEESRILRSATVPEHLVSLVRLVSGGEPFLVEDHVCYAGEDWCILVGFPLAGSAAPDALPGLVDRVERRFRPIRLWLVTPEIPATLASRCRERESDAYYTLPLAAFAVPAALRRTLRRASAEIAVERGRSLTEGHQAAIAEFLARAAVPPRIEHLYQAMAHYTARAAGAAVLTARDATGAIAALYVVDLAAERFATYVVGCHSRKHYVPGASDVLFAEMAALAREHGKEYLHLGLGVNPGIRRFKEKWGGVASLRYEACECARPDRLRLALLRWPWA
jgi:hypothetical protein